MILQVIALSTVASFCSEQTGHQLFHRQSSYEMWKKRQGSGFERGDLMKTWPMIGFQYKSFNSHNMFCGLVDLMRNSELQNTYRQGERGQFILPNVCRRNFSYEYLIHWCDSRLFEHPQYSQSMNGFYFNCFPRKIISLIPLME